MRDFMAYVRLKCPVVSAMMEANLPVPSSSTQERTIAESRAPVELGLSHDMIKHAITCLASELDRHEVIHGQCPWILASDETAITAAATYYRKGHRIMGVCGVVGDPSGASHECTLSSIELPPDLDNSAKYPDGLSYLKGLLAGNRLASCRHFAADCRFVLLF